MKNNQISYQISHILIHLTYQTPFGLLDVVQEGEKVSFYFDTMSIGVNSFGEPKVNIPNRLVLSSNQPLVTQLRRFQAALAYWKQAQKPHITQDNILPKINLKHIMTAVYPCLLEEAETVVTQITTFEKERQENDALKKKLNRLPDRTMLLSTGVVADFEEGSKNEDTNCVCLLKLLKDNNSFRIVLGNGSPLPEYFEDALPISKIQLATSENIKELLKSLHKPARTKVLFLRQKDVDTKETLLAEKILNEMNGNTTMPVQRQEHLMISEEEWLNGI